MSTPENMNKPTREERALVVAKLKERWPYIDISGDDDKAWEELASDAFEIVREILDV